VPKWPQYKWANSWTRASTDGQSLAAQIAELRTAKCEKVFQEKISGSRSDRKQLARLMGALSNGDLLVVTRLDRLARSTRDLLNLLGTIAERGAGFRSLRDTWADTTTAHGRLMLTVLGGLAEFERELIRTRTSEGRERAKARGVTLGRKPNRPAANTAHPRRRGDRIRDAQGASSLNSGDCLALEGIGRGDRRNRAGHRRDTAA
jgi:DNA invertase Pin-like site-specific DNA recombinase